MAKRSKQLLLRVESVRRDSTAGEGRGGGCQGAGGVSAYGMGTKGACWNMCPPKDDGDCEVERKRRRTVVLLHCSISGAYLNSGLRLELGPKKCFVSKVFGLRLLLVLVHCLQQERAGVLGISDNPS